MDSPPGALRPKRYASGQHNGPFAKVKEKDVSNQVVGPSTPSIAARRTLPLSAGDFLALEWPRGLRGNLTTNPLSWPGDYRAGNGWPPLSGSQDIGRMQDGLPNASCRQVGGVAESGLLPERNLMTDPVCPQCQKPPPSKHGAANGCRFWDDLAPRGSWSPDACQALQSPTPRTNTP